MPVTVFSADATGTGVRAPLADGDDVYVRRGVLVSSSDNHAIDGIGNGHSAVIYGEVVGGLTGMTLGFDAGSSAQKVTIYEGGAVSGFGTGYGGIAILGYGDEIDNAGDIWGESYGVYHKGTRTSGSSTTIDNSGTIHGGDYGLYFAGNDAVTINNTGVIEGDDNGIYLLGSAGGFYIITNDGLIDGGIFAAAADFVYYYGQNGRLTDGDLFGGSGGDRLFGGAYSESFNGAGGSDELDGGGGDDSLSGGTEGDTLRGGSGNDGLDGGEGADFMAGGAGDDFYYVDNVGDIVTEKVGEGLDQVNSSVNFSLVGLEVERLFLSDGALKGTGNAYANYVIGNDLANILDGKQGADIIIGGAGNDTIYVDNAGDLVGESAGGGTDIVAASVSFSLSKDAAVESLRTTSVSGTTAINLSGNDFSQSVYGNAGANNIKGLGGNDSLRGYGGNDTLTGGTGIDTFVFNSALNASTNVDRIADFNATADTIQVDNAFFLGLATGVLSASAFKDIATAAQDASDRILYNSDTGSLFFDRDGSGGTYTAIKFASLTGSPAITAADFVVI